jgi:pimeloyl-ACP methyl ester carboxylesterase
MTTREAPRSFAGRWEGRGYVTDFDGPVHWVDFGAPSELPPLVFVHGLGGSHLNWALAAPGLSSNRRAIAIDLHGFGMTAGTKRNSTVHENQRLLDRFILEVVGGPVVLVGNSMGGMVSVLQTHRNPDTVAGVVLVAPALPVPSRRPDPRVAAQFLVYALPGVGELSMRVTRARLSPAGLVQRIVQLCYADPTRANPDMLAAAEDLIRARDSIPGLEAAFMSAARSLMRVLVRPEGYSAMMGGIDVPVLLMNGEADRLVPVAAARRTALANPSWEAVFLAGVGHTPQLEVPDTFVELVSDWLARTPSLTAS